MIISIVVAADESGVIGRENKLPWDIAGELARFKKLTMGHHILMGRKTHESIGKVLPGRINIVVTRSKDYQAKGAIVVGSVEEGIDYAKNHDESELMVIGGEQIYKQVLSKADKIYLTRVFGKHKGDRFFEFDEQEWRVVKKMNFRNYKVIEYQK